MELSLQILMGLNCNFTCGHCLNDSGPGIRKVDFSKKDAESILSSLREHQNISSIGFSGGEPLLYIEQIEALLRDIADFRPLETLSISITSNGSLISKYADQIKKLKIDKILLSYDRFHSEFLSEREFEDVVKLSKTLFKNVEINFVMETDQDLDLIRNTALGNDVKIQVSKPVKSGRYNLQQEQTKTIQFRQLKCPNMRDLNLNMISYFPNKGYSICCGPLIFGHHGAEDSIAFESIKDVLNSEMFKVLKKAQNVYLKMNADLDCDSCTNIFKKTIVKKHLSDFLRDSAWENFHKFDEFTIADLDELDSIFQPKIVFSAPKNALKQSRDATEEGSLKIDISSKLSKDEIRQASDFTKHSFYNTHDNHYFESDLKRFHNQQEYFFSLPLQSVRHFDRHGQLMGFLVLGRIDDHPHFNESVWHVGYWGMSADLIDRKERRAIKKSWHDTLVKLNQANRIVSLVDYFNYPAIEMAKRFDLESIGYRLDPRE